MTASINVPFVNLGLQFKKNENDFQLLLNEIGNNGHYIMGKYLELFENQFASYCNRNLQLALQTQLITYIINESFEYWCR